MGPRWLLLAALLVGAAPAAAGGWVRPGPGAVAPGEIFAVTAGGVPPGVRPEVVFRGRRFGVWPGEAEGEWLGLVAVDRDELPGPGTLAVVEAGSEPARELAAEGVAVAPRTYPEQRLTVDQRTVTLSPQDQERAAREALLIREALALRSPERSWDGGFRRPAEGPVSSPFGVRRVYNGVPKGYHGGLDLAAPRGAPVRAAAAGRVALVGDYFYTGWSVFIDHGVGLVTAYFHLDAATVSPGQAVGAGDLLGVVGSTGRSTGPHLHWGVYLAGVRADPLSLLAVAAAP